MVVVDSKTEVIFEGFATTDKLRQIQSEVTWKAIPKFWKNSKTPDAAIFIFSPSNTGGSVVDILDHSSVCSWYQTNHSQLEKYERFTRPRTLRVSLI